VIAASDVVKRFGRGSGVTALDGISFDIAQGEFVTLLGPSGCGKSTLLRCFAGLEQPTSGKLLIDGRPVDGPPDRLGMAFQRDALLRARYPAGCASASPSAVRCCSIRGCC
jgi:NitT/TauT family transport system ATP-binding protein